MVNFCLKVAQIGDLSSKIQWYESFDLARANMTTPDFKYFLVFEIW